MGVNHSPLSTIWLVKHSTKYICWNWMTNKWFPIDINIQDTFKLISTNQAILLNCVTYKRKHSYECSHTLITDRRCKWSGQVDYYIRFLTLCLYISSQVCMCCVIWQTFHRCSHIFLTLLWLKSFITRSTEPDQLGDHFQFDDTGIKGNPRNQAKNSSIVRGKRVSYEACNTGWCWTISEVDAGRISAGSLAQDWLV